MKVLIPPRKSGQKKPEAEVESTPRSGANSETTTSAGGYSESSQYQKIKPPSVGGKQKGNKRQKPMQSAQVTAYDKAIYYLARREHSSFEIEQKLRQKGYQSTEVDQAVESLIATNLLSDQRFCESFVRSRILRGHGPLKIELELQQKGVATELIQLAMEQQEQDWNDLAHLVYSKKFGTQPPNTFKEWSKRARFLQSRGFSSRTIRDVCPDIDFDD